MYMYNVYVHLYIIICVICLQTGLYVFYTMVTQRYPIKTHFTSLLSSRKHSTMLISVYCESCQTVKMN